MDLYGEEYHKIVDVQRAGPTAEERHIELTMELHGVTAEGAKEIIRQQQEAMKGGAKSNRRRS